MSLFTRLRIAALVIVAVNAVAPDALCQDPKQVILLESMPVPVVLQHSRWFMKEMSDLGYERGDTMNLLHLRANGDRAKAETLLRGAVNKQKPDLVVANATLASQAANKILKGTEIPVVFMSVPDPVGADLISKIGSPTNTNITGTVPMIDGESRISMVMRLIGPAFPRKPIRIGFIHSSQPSPVGDLRDLSAVTQKRDDVIFLSYAVRYRKLPEGLPAMLKDATEGIKALDDSVNCWWEPSGPMGETPEYSQLLLTYSTHPVVMGTDLKSVELGALMHVTSKIEASGREAARLADAILKGANPGEIPPKPPADIDIGINLKTATKHNISIPADVIRLAGDQVFE